MTDQSAEQKNVKILIVDDHSQTRTLVRSILRAIGYVNVFQAENGMEAIQIITRENLELVVCDWNMPGMSGIEVLREVRSMPAYKELPFLMLTAEAYRENVTEAMKAGVTDYVVKPFSADTLMSKVAEILDRKNAAKQ